MTRYEFLVLLHIVSVILWLGANAVVDLLFFRAERRRDPAELGRMGETQEWLPPRLYIPVSLATVISGALLIWDGPWSFGDLWVAIGFGAWIATFATGFFFLKPSGERIKRIVEQQGPMSPEAQKIGARLSVVARVQLLALFLVVADMVLKPTTDDPWALVVLALLLAAAIVAAAVSLRRRAAVGSPAAPVG
jgi:uncharacterized membrane protein